MDLDPAALVPPRVPLHWTGSSGLRGEGLGGMGLQQGVEKEKKKPTADPFFYLNKTERIQGFSGLNTNRKNT